MDKRKFIYLLTDLDENKEKNACIRTEDGFRVIFTVRVGNQDVILQQLTEDMINMVNIFDESAELDENGYIIGPSYTVLDWSDDIVDRYRESIE